MYPCLCSWRYRSAFMVSTLNTVLLLIFHRCSWLGWESSLQLLDWWEILKNHEWMLVFGKYFFMIIEIFFFPQSENSELHSLLFEYYANLYSWAKSDLVIVKFNLPTFGYEILYLCSCGISVVFFLCNILCWHQYKGNADFLKW